MFLTVHYGSWLFSMFFTGICNGVIWGFLFWHIENIGKIKTGCTFYFPYINVFHIYAARKKHLGLVVQSIVSLTSSLRGQLVKCFVTL